MPSNQIGEDTYPKTTKLKGQKVWKYEDYFAFVLEKGVYFKGGKVNWPEEYEKGNISSPSIGLNVAIWNKIVLPHVLNGSYDLIVYDKKKRKFYKLESDRIPGTNKSVIEVSDIEKRKEWGKPLVITPKDAYTEVRNESKLDPKIKGLKSN